MVCFPEYSFLQQFYTMTILQKQFSSIQDIKWECILLNFLLSRYESASLLDIQVTEKELYSKMYSKYKRWIFTSFMNVLLGVKFKNANIPPDTCTFARKTFQCVHLFAPVRRLYYKIYFSRSQPSMSFMLLAEGTTCKICFAFNNKLWFHLLFVLEYFAVNIIKYILFKVLNQLLINY